MLKREYIIGELDTIVGKVPQVSTTWSNTDVWSTIKVRWSIGRMNYKVKQGLYAVGNPDKSSSIFVTANYKLSFDHIRLALKGIDAWMLVLDTKGINVWCAAGKGTFGTKELSYRIKAHGLEKLVDHKKVIVPQLGAVGVAAHEVKSKTGFTVMYGPVLAEDIKAYISSGYKVTAEMRKVRFTLMDRVKLIPVELSYGKYYLLLVPAVFFILAGLNPHGYSIDLAWENGSLSIIYLLVAYFSGCVLTPLFLPWIPFRSFSLKGLFTGWLTAGIIFYFLSRSTNIIEIISWFLMMGSISSFLSMNFTGTSTYTSLSGVQKEMKISLPAQIIAAGIGFITWIILRFL